MVGREVEWKGCIFNIISVYAPNTINEQCDFVQSLYETLNSKKNMCICGDFNFVPDIKDHKSNQVKTNNKKNAKSWNSFFKSFNLRELEWKKNIEKEQMMTWTNGRQTSRIDRMLIKNDFVFETKYCDNIDFIMSDHRMVIAELSNKKCRATKRRTTWKLNENVLESKRMCDRIKSLCESINDLQINWYDNFNKVINILKQESRILNKINNEVKNSLFKRVSELDGLDMEEEKEVIKNEIEDFYKKQREGNEKRVCDIRMSFYKHPTKVLIEKESNNNKKCAIEKFKRKNGSETSDSEEIIKDVFEFYNNLLGKDKVDEEGLREYRFQSKSLNNSEIIEQINKPMTYDEVLIASYI